VRFVKNNKKQHDKASQSGEERKSFLDRLPLIQIELASSAGKVRAQNEDALFALSTQVSMSASQYALGLFLIADGMGGHVDGERASSLAVQTASNVLLDELLKPLQAGQPLPNAEQAETVLNLAMQAAQKAVIKRLPGSGSTLTMAMLLNWQLYFAHVGDTRIYLAQQGSALQALTTDHSVARRLVDLGQIDAEEALVTPLRNNLFRAIGQGDGFYADFGHVELSGPAKLLLCSDGLWSSLPEETLKQMLEAKPLPVDTAQQLVEVANTASGSDNISAIVVNIL